MGLSREGWLGIVLLILAPTVLGGYYWVTGSVKDLLSGTESVITIIVSAMLISGATLVYRGRTQSHHEQTPIPPLDYQVNALTQVLNQWLRSTGSNELSDSDLRRILSQPGLRDGINPLFEPLTLENVQSGLMELVKRGNLTINGNSIFIGQVRREPIEPPPSKEEVEKEFQDKMNRAKENLEKAKKYMLDSFDSFESNWDVVAKMAKEGSVPAPHNRSLDFEVEKLVASELEMESARIGINSAFDVKGIEGFSERVDNIIHGDTNRFYLIILRNLHEMIDEGRKLSGQILARFPNPPKQPNLSITIEEVLAGGEGIKFLLHQTREEVSKLYD